VIPEWFQVIEGQREIEDVYSFKIRPREGQRYLGHAPGQFYMLYSFAAGEVPISISGDCSEQGEVIHTIKGVGPVSKALCRLKPGDEIGVRGPFGEAWPVEKVKGKHLLIIAGGLGMAPLRPVVYHYLNHQKDFAGASLLYGARNLEGLLYTEEIAGWKNSGDLNVFMTVDQDSKCSPWDGHVGMVTELIPLAKFDPQHTVAMVCGPEIMMKFVARKLLEVGMDENDVFVSMERNMKCALGRCGHCQFGPEFVCKDGPVFPYARIKDLISVREL
jgi:NAD(P)H-flavin reductase